MDNPPMSLQRMSLGKSPKLDVTIIEEAPKTPINLPKQRPAMIPMLMGCKSIPKTSPFNVTPAFASANNGNIKK